MFKLRHESVGNLVKMTQLALTAVAQLVGHHPTERNVASWIPSQGTHLGCGFGTWSGRVWEETDQCFFLTLIFSPSRSPSLPSLYK